MRGTARLNSGLTLLGFPISLLCYRMLLGAQAVMTHIAVL